MTNAKNNQEFISKMEHDIELSALPEAVKRKLIANLLLLKAKKVNLLITGATGCGKSSTINALFDADVSKVGVGVDPETMDIEKYELGNLILWDSPGLGDGKEADNRHAKNLTKKLLERDSEGNPLIDLVLVILDGSSRDMGTSFELISNVIVPNLGEDKSRILVAINQADMAMKGRGWNREDNRPEPELERFLNEKVESVRRRIKESTGVDVEPIYYSAGYKDGDKPQRPYNLTKLLYQIVHYTPKQKRTIYVNNINRDREMWKDDDDLKDYRNSILDDIVESISDCADVGADIGESLGGLFGSAGRAVGRVAGRVVGSAFGAIKSIAKSFFGGIFGW
ncbi:GTPase [uncultured Fibrobacter sp.]|uniref:GTPase family protein n=1 Tax=uncultured Fibrobacter sp. TaxID=261512 RepID=UPI0025F281B4|nr:GTPase [uncultured Fibrobacter sp.]